MRASFLCVGVAFAVAGCAATPPKHSGLTLDNALKDLGKGLYDMHNAAHPAGSDDKPFGLFAEEVTVTFNVTASKTSSSDNKLYVDLDASVPSIPISAGAGASSETTQQSTHTRGNTIVIKFLNPYFAPPDTAIYAAVSPFPPAGSSSATKATTKPSSPDNDNTKTTDGSGSGGASSQAPTMPLNGNGPKNFKKVMNYVFDNEESNAESDSKLKSALERILNSGQPGPALDYRRHVKLPPSTQPSPAANEQ